MKERGVAEDRAGAEPQHRLRIDERWSVWRDVVLRSTGFPVDLLDRFASAELTRSAERLLAAQERQDAALSAAKQLCYQRLKRPDCANRGAWRRVMRQLKAGREPVGLPKDADLGAAVEAVAPARGELEAARTACEQAWSDAERATSAQLRALAAHPRFREAVAWQNRHALETGLDALLRRAPDIPANALSRQHELLVARYLQRYAAKNDTIGFFGPVGWARILDSGMPLCFKPGESLAVDPVVEFEPWAIQAVARKISEAPALRPWLAPVPHPALRREGEDVVVLLERRMRLPQREALAIDACDGSTSARSLAAKLVGERPQLFLDDLDVFGTLERLAAARLIHWRLAIPLAASTDGYLRTALEQLPPAAPVGPFIGAVASLTALKADVHQAFGDGNAVAAATARLETEFARIAGAPATHLPGQSYAGRTLVYLDTRRDATCAMSEAMVRELGKSLRPVLAAASWCSRQFFAQFIDFIDGAYADCRRATGLNAVPLDTLWYETQQRSDIVDAIREDVLEQLAERWAALMRPSQDARTVVFSSDSLAPRLAEAFGDAPEGWPGARFQAPDVMLAAESVEAVAEGRYRFILGELHPADMSVLRGLFLRSHANPARLVEAAGIDYSQPQLRAMFRTESALFRTRTNPDSPIDFEIECDELRSALPRDRVIASGALLMERDGEGLVLRTRDGKHEFPAGAFFGPQAGALLGNRFSLFTPGAHTPRVTIDRLIVHRESWRVPLDSLGFVRDASARDRFVGAQRWARALGVPRRCFYRLLGEPKPLFLDLESPVYVEMLAKLVRAAHAAKAEHITIAEMLPGPDEAWLTDARGSRYTSEFRMLFVDRC